MKYNEAEQLITSGSLVFFKSKTFIQKVVSVFTRGRFAHVGFAFWVTGETGERLLMFVDTAPGGKKIAMLKSYKHCVMEIIDVGLDWKKVESLALKDTGTTKYSYLDAIILGIEKTFGISLTRKTYGEVCSEFAARILSNGRI
jgi:hypothetical protein